MKSIHGVSEVVDILGSVTSSPTKFRFFNRLNQCIYDASFGQLCRSASQVRLVLEVTSLPYTVPVLTCSMSRDYVVALSVVQQGNEIGTIDQMYVDGGTVTFVGELRFG